MTRFFAILLLILLTAPARAAVLEFRERASVAGPSITLGDIARCHEDALLCPSLNSQQLMAAPTIGDSLTLVSEKIVAHLRGQLPATVVIDWQGSPAVVISRQAQQISGAQIGSQIEQYLALAASQHRLPKADIRFTPSEQPLPFLLPAGQLEWEIIPGNPAILGSSRFAVIIKVDGKVCKNLSVLGQLEALAPVAVASADLDKGIRLQASQFTMQRRDISTLDKPCLDLTELRNQRLTRALKAGAVLSLAAMETPPVVLRGEMVKMVVRQGDLLLTATGIAQNDGALDQTVRVENPSSKKIIRGRVSGPGLVEVLL